MRALHLGATIAAGLLVGAASPAWSENGTDVPVNSPTHAPSPNGLFAPRAAEPAYGGASAVPDARYDARQRVAIGGSAEEDEEIRRGYRPGGPAWEGRGRNLERRSDRTQEDRNRN